jgi:conjugative relaxase-like TrwC/TraI family protein
LEDLADVAWMRMMGEDSVAYHRATVLARGDDHPGQALAYYASRGETPLMWGGRGAHALGLEGAITDAQYELLFGPGGACDPTTGERLVTTKRPGLELVVSAHKSVAELGVIGRADDMHAIMDAERDATLAYLDQLTGAIGGRRGRTVERTKTEGLIYALTRHATSRAGDPCPHDHVLIANLVRMDDATGGWKAADTALWREHLHAATMVGRVASAQRAVELGYGIVADTGPSGRLGHWAIAGVPDAVMEAHSKRAAEIDAEMARTGHDSYRARGIAARTTRDPKRHTPVGELLPRWVAEIEAVGSSIERIVDAVEHEAAEYQRPRPELNNYELRNIATEALADGSPLIARKVFAKRDVIVAVAPSLYGRNLSELGPVVSRTLADPETVPLLRVHGAHQPVYTTATAIAREEAIAHSVASQLQRTRAPAVVPEVAEAALARAEASLGRSLTAGQREAVEGVLTSGRGVELIVGVAGSGKTTALAAARDGFEAAGFEVVGTSTSGQAARTLGREAGIDPSSTLASLNWRIAHNTLQLSSRHVAVLDEAAMTDDTAMLAFLEAARETGTKVVAVGDHRQLGSVAPGGGFEALVRRFGGAVHVLDENVRQVDPVERTTLDCLRSGVVEAAVAWYAARGRITVSADRDTALEATVAGWAADVAGGSDAAMYAWRRANVAELNRRGRQAWETLGKLSGPELVVGTTAYRAGDRVVVLAPGAGGEIVTSERGTVEAVDLKHNELGAVMDDGRFQRFAGDDLDPDHLAHGYAVTVHRSQGATVQRAHALEDGGGRELAYVKMSRAEERSTVYVVADSLDQAVEDLERSWSQSRRIGWAIDAGTPAPGTEVAAPPHREDRNIDASLCHARLVAERDAVAAVVPVDPGFEYPKLQNQVRRMEAALEELEKADGTSSWQGTPVGAAAIAWQDALREWRWCWARSEHVGWRERHRLIRRADRAEGREGPLRDAYERLAAPERTRLGAELAEAKELLADLDGRFYGNLHFQIRHPEALRRLERLDSQIAAVSRELDVERQGLDGMAPLPLPSPKRDWGIERDGPVLERGIDLGIGR